MNDASQDHAPLGLTYAIQHLDETAANRAPYLLCKGFVQAGWNVEIVTTEDAERNAGMDRLWNSVPIHKVGHTGARRKQLKLGLRLLLPPARNRIAISWVWDWHCFALALAKRLFGSPYAIVLDTYTFKASPGGAQRLREGLRYGFVLRHADVILAEAPKCLEHARRHLAGSSRSLLVPSCYWMADLRAVESRWESERYDPPRRPVILYVGRILPRKNIHDLIAAFHQVSHAFPEWSIEVRGPVADPDYLRRLRAQAAELGLEDRVRFFEAEWGEDVYRRYREAAIVALPSQAEGFPSMILEAMFFGGAIVASSVGYVGYQLGEDEREDAAGLLHAAGDVDALSGHLQALMASPDLRAGLAARARKRLLDLFTWERYFPMLESTFREIIERSRARRRGAGRKRLRRPALPVVHGKLDEAA